MMYSVRTKHLYGQAYSTQDRDEIIIFKIDGKMVVLLLLLLTTATSTATAFNSSSLSSLFD